MRLLSCHTLLDSSASHAARQLGLCLDKVLAPEGRHTAASVCPLLTLRAAALLPELIIGGKSLQSVHQNNMSLWQALYPCRYSACVLSFQPLQLSFSRAWLEPSSCMFYLKTLLSYLVERHTFWICLIKRLKEMLTYLTHEIWMALSPRAVIKHEFITPFMAVALCVGHAAKFQAELRIMTRCLSASRAGLYTVKALISLNRESGLGHVTPAENALGGL